MAGITHLPAASDTTTRLLGESTCVLSAGAWFSATTSVAFTEAVQVARGAGAREILLDLTAVRAVDVVGTKALGGLIEELETCGCELAVATTHPGLAAWLESAPLEVELPVFDTVEDGLADLLRRPL